ncbi:Major facilitator superfamily associated domain [Trinorchestia longiramus]|nr:Major facilitator superfamily associated domain [Trinorchestia longiramus]
MSVRRQLAWQARRSSTRLRNGGVRAATSCWTDLLTPRLVPVKLSFFLIMGATQCLGPYSTLFARALGLNLKETAIVFSVAPIIPLLAPLLAGIIADKIGNFKAILVLCVVVSGLLPLLLMCIPPARIPTTTPIIPMLLTCQGDDFILRLAGSRADCDSFIKNSSIPKVEARNCGYVCHPPVVQYPPSLEQHFSNISVGATATGAPAALDEEFTCWTGRRYNDPQKCFISRYNESFLQLEGADLTTFSLYEVGLNFVDLDVTPNTVKLRGHYQLTPLDQHIFDCMNGLLAESHNISTILLGGAHRSKSDPVIQPSISCHFECNVFLKKDVVCTTTSTEATSDPTLTMWAFAGLKIGSAFCTGLTYTMFEVATIAVLRHYGHDYGLQRLHGSVGGMVVAPLAGLLIDAVGDGTHYQHYYASFGLFTALKLLCAVVLLTINLGFKPPSTNLFRNIFKLLLTAEVALLTCAVLVSGVCYGFIEHYQPWLLRDLKASNWFIGLTTTVASLAALPFLAVSGAVCAKFGHVQSICFGLICYAIRCVGYSLLTDPLWCIPLEVAEGATTGLLIASSVLYAAHLAHPQAQATLQGLLATVHYGVGKSVGSFAGGYLMSELGTPSAFQIFASISLSSAFLYYIIYKLFMFPRMQNLESLRRQINNMPIKTVSIRDHRRHSARYDENLVVNPEEETLGPMDRHVTVREATLNKKAGAEQPAYRFQQMVPNHQAAFEHETPFPSWSDDEETEPSGLYPILNSTPLKHALPPPDCELSTMITTVPDSDETHIDDETNN